MSEESGDVWAVWDDGTTRTYHVGRSVNRASGGPVWWWSWSLAPIAMHWPPHVPSPLCLAALAVVRL